MRVLLNPIVGADRRAAPFAGNGLEAAKLAAIVLMTVNHVTDALSGPWVEWGYLAGRLCLPIFAFTLVMRLADDPVERSARAFRRLAAWGAVAQPIYLLLASAIAIRLDVLFTLAAGVMLIHLVAGRRHLAAVVLAAGLILGDRWLDGGALTPLGMLAAFIATRHSVSAAVVSIIVACALQNYLSVPSIPLGAAAVLLAPLVLWASPLLASLVPRLPKHAFYAYYPLHLLAIYLVLGPYP